MKRNQKFNNKTSKPCENCGSNVQVRIITEGRVSARRCYMCRRFGVKEIVEMINKYAEKIDADNEKG